MDTHAQGTPGVDLGRWIRHLFQDFDQPLDPAIARLYIEGLQHIPVRFLNALVKRARARPDAPTEVPPVAWFTEHWHRYRISKAADPLETWMLSRLGPDEIRPARDCLNAIISTRLSGMTRRPINTQTTAEIVFDIAELVLAEFRAEFPTGLDAEHAHDVTVRYLHRARRLFDDAVARQFTLTTEDANAG